MIAWMIFVWLGTGKLIKKFIFFKKVCHEFWSLAKCSSNWLNQIHFKLIKFLIKLFVGEKILTERKWKRSWFSLSAGSLGLEKVGKSLSQPTTLLLELMVGKFSRTSIRYGNFAVREAVELMKRHGQKLF